MPCKESKVASGWFEGQIDAVMDDLSATEAAVEAFRVRKREQLREFFDGLCEDGCELKVKDDAKIVLSPEDPFRLGVRYWFEFYCADPGEGGGK